MLGFVVNVVVFGLLVIFGSGSFGAVLAQDFPYAVPQAPEFDDRGNPVNMRDSELQATRSRVKRGPYSSNMDAQSDYRSVRPYAPQGGPQPVSVPPSASAAPVSAPRSPSIGSEQAPPTVRAPRGQAREPMGPQPPGQPPQGQPQGMPDCSHFPQLLARAGSEPEMQTVAKEYLTCLLHSGWTMEQARSHVINTIEMTYRLAR
jgi:hypothetical protein